MWVSKQTILLRCLLSVGILSSSLCQDIPSVRVSYETYTSWYTNLHFNFVILGCYVTADPTHISVSWLRVINENTSSIINVNNTRKYTVNTPFLFVLHPDESDEGYYICTATNDVGTFQSSQTLLVLFDYSTVDKITCDFEDGESCPFKNSAQDDFDWTKTSGTTPSGGTGPASAYNGSFYQYIEGSSPVGNLQTAILTTEGFTLLSEVSYCLQFAYHMKGNPGNLTITANDAENYFHVPVFQKYGHQGDDWIRYSVDIPGSSNLVINIRGYRSNSQKGDIAIDDLVLEVGACDQLVVNIPEPTYTVITGQNVTLVCNVTSTNPFARVGVYWVKDFFIDWYSISQGSANSMFSRTIFNASQSDAGTYGCLGFYIQDGIDGMNYSSTTLIVLGGFNIITRLTIDGNLHEDSVATFVCSANISGIVGNIKTVWKLNDAVITPTSTSRWQTGIFTENPEDQAIRQYYLQVNPLHTADAGSITCQLSHGTDQTEMKVNVSVIGKPVVSLSPTTLTVYKGDTIFINCVVSEWFATNTSIVWYQDGVMVQSKKGQMTDVLNVSEIQGTAMFECSAMNEAGEGKRRRSIINVIEPGVSYKFCPIEVDAFNTTWISTIGATTVEISCNRNYTGIKTRFCNADGSWEEPNYSACVREDLQVLQKQSEYLMDGVQVIDVDTMLLELTRVTSEDNVDLTSGDLDVTSSILLNVADIAPRSTHSEDKDQLEIFISSCNNVLQTKNKPSWKQLSSLNLGGITKIAAAVTTYTKAYISVNNIEFQRVVVKDNIVVEVGKTLSQDITLPNKSLLLSSWLSESESRITLEKVNINETFLYSSAFYRNISDLFHHYILPVGSAEPVNSSYDVNSMIVDFSIEPTPEKLVKPVVVEFDHISAGLSDPLCVFWNFSVPNTPNGAWSLVGSRLVNSDAVSTVCEFDHTTNFAVLMSPARTPASHMIALDVISAVGCGVSLLFLVVTLVVYGVLWRYVNSDRGKGGKVRERAIMLVNLCTALIISYALFMAGIKQTRNKTFCTAIAVMLHYIFLVDFSLMLAEGVTIAFSLMQVFSQKSRIRWLLPSCWSVPAIVVVISASVTKLEGYGTPAFCWLSLDSGLLWAFAGPVLLIIMINFVMLVLVIRISLRTHLMKAKNIKDKAKAEISNICVLLPLFGLTWSFGLLSVNDESVVFQYIFAILNSLQGFFIFVFHCFLDKTVRKGIQHLLRKRRSSQLDSTTNSHRNKNIYSSSKNETSTSYLESSKSTGLHVHESTKETNNGHAATTTEENDTNKKGRKTLQEDTNTRKNYARSDKPYDVHEDNADSEQQHDNRIRRRSTLTDNKQTAVPQIKGRHKNSKSQRFHAEIPVDRKIRSKRNRHPDTLPAIDDYRFHRDYYGGIRDANQEGYNEYQQFGENTGRFYPPFFPDFPVDRKIRSKSTRHPATSPAIDDYRFYPDYYGGIRDAYQEEYYGYQQRGQNTGRFNPPSIPDYYGRHIYQYGYNDPDFE